MAFCKIVCSIFFMLLLWTPDLQAPEIAERDLFGFTPYRIAEDGSVADAEGAVRGWIREDRIYDAQWNVMYRVDGPRLSRVAQD
jgi:hypothetical protein